MTGSDQAAGWRVRRVEPWWMVTPPDHLPRRQGWKLHVSATLASAPRVLERAGRVLVAHGCAFKFASGPQVTAELTGTRAARAQSGKFLTAYPADDDRLRALAQELDEATAGLPGPAILSDRRYRPDSVVHYRYGCFARSRVLNDEGFYEGRLVAPDGSLSTDQRNPWFSPPPWAEDPFARPEPAAEPAAEPPSATPPRRRGAPVLLAGRYLVKEAIRHSNRGGVYRAEDTRGGGTVLLKEARPHVGADPEGRDTRDRLRHEARVLDELAPLGVTPRVRELFESGGHLFLVEDLVPGRNLQQWTAEHLERGDGSVPVPAALGLARALVALIGRVHAAGYVLRDFKPGNVIMTPEERPVLVDLELAVPLGSAAHPAGTRGFTDPGYLNAGHPTATPAPTPAPSPGPEADCFSLGATLLHVTSGISPVLADDGAPARPPGERLAALVAAADDLPALRALGPLVAGLSASAPRRWTLPRAEAYLRTGLDPGGREHLPEPPSAERLIEDGLAHLAATADPAAEYLWPAPRSLPDGDPCNVQLGAAGVLAVLTRAVRRGYGAARPTLRTAADWLDERLTEPDRILPGLHFGRSGTVWALHEAATTLEDRRLADRALDHALRIPLDTRSADVCHGLAGAGLAQLHLWRRTGDRRLADRAQECADGLLYLLKDRDGVDWPLGPEHRAELAGSGHYGFAHGVAGNAAFLLAAGRELGRPELTDIALGGGEALCALTDWRDGAAYWPKGPGRADRPGLDYWCHGSSGIGSYLVRLWQETGDPRHLAHAEGAALAVHRDRHRLGPGTCHGLAGNAELLLDLYAATGDRRHLARADDLVRGIALRAALRDGRYLVPDDTLREVTAAYNVGYGGVLDLLLRRRHGGPRSWLVDRPAAEPHHHPSPGKGG
ncbi:class IV lanthionine synthetase LanL [Kitasatospora xanthocidica]|uniref:class IV lanthionine synthetase LanL n=1 Tax=Kitasatospora xanthocidica TaxID=83382 RepID=UPI001E365444|nr:class IV lanthionine synthetase LanL [Kitasatospora xanthocidica]